MRLLGAAGAPCGACQDTAEALADPHPSARGMVAEVDYPGREGAHRTVGCPVKLSDSPVEAPPPRWCGPRPSASTPAASWRSSAAPLRRNSPAGGRTGWCDGPADPGPGQYRNCPPLTCRVCPVTWADSPERRKTANEATSSGVAIRPRGISAPAARSASSLIP